MNDAKVYKQHHRKSDSSLIINEFTQNHNITLIKANDTGFCWSTNFVPDVQ